MLFKSVKTCFIVILLVGCMEPIKVEQDKKEIKETLIKCGEDWSRGDLKAYLDIYWKSDELQFIGPKGLIYGYDNVYELYSKRYTSKEEMGTLSLKILDIKYLSKHLYSVTGTYFITRKKMDSTGIYSLVFKKIEDKWVVVSDHTQ